MPFMAKVGFATKLLSNRNLMRFPLKEKLPINSTLRLVIMINMLHKLLDAVIASPYLAIPLLSLKTLSGIQIISKI